MLSWASQQFEKISQQVAPPPDEGVGKFVYSVQKGDEDAAMGAVAVIDPVNTIVNQSKGLYPIHMACHYSMARLIQLLLTQPGATLDVMDVQGNSPMHYAAMSTQPDALKVVQTLVSDYNASVTTKNLAGKTPYDVCSINSVRQYLLPIQLQAETQFALDNGGVGLPPGIDLGGMRIKNSNIAPPPTMIMGGQPQQHHHQMGGLSSPPPMQPFGQPQPHMANASVSAYGSVAPAPASMPVPSLSGHETYARVGSSSAAIFSKPTVKGRGFVRPDGFHSSSSDVNLQKKYGHHSATARAVSVAPPPSSGGSVSASASSVGDNPFAAGRSLSASRYGSLPPSSQRYVSYGPTSPAPAPYQNYDMAQAPAHVATFTLQGQQQNYDQQQQSQYAQQPAAQPIQETLQTPSSPFMPPPPYSSQGQAPTTPAQPSFSDLVSPAAATVGSEPRTPSSLFSPQHENSISESGTQLFSSPGGTDSPAPTSESVPHDITASVTDMHTPPPAGDNPDNALPHGWSQTEDPSTGQVYYFNSVTNETSWERPAAPVQEQTETLAPVGPEAPAPTESEDSTRPATGDAPLPEGWNETQDPSSGAIYYFNSLTNETSWERPTESVSAEPTVVSESVAAVGTEAEPESETVPEAVAAQSEWMEAQDPTSGKIYYYNSATNETSWERPADFIAPDTQQVPEEYAVEAEPEAETETSDISDTVTVEPLSAAVPAAIEMPSKEPLKRAQSAEELFGDEPVVDEPVVSDNQNEVFPLSGAATPHPGSLASALATSPAKSLQRAQSAEELFGDAPAADEPIVSDNQNAVFPPSGAATPHPGSLASALATSPAKSLQRGQSAEELFEEPMPVEDEPKVMPSPVQPAAAQTAGGVFGDNSTTELAQNVANISMQSTPGLNADDVFASAAAPAANQVIAAIGINDAVIPSTEPTIAAATEELTDNEGEDLMTEVPLSPQGEPSEPAAQPSTESGADLFAAIGMPPPPFQSKKP